VFALRNGGAGVAEWHDTTEEYLEAILEIEEEGTIPIRARLVERLGLSAPAVSETVNRLVDHGYAELMDDRSLRLTDEGREIATSIVRRHRLAALPLQMLGLTGRQRVAAFMQLAHHGEGGVFVYLERLKRIGNNKNFFHGIQWFRACSLR
jgi:Mn-dependent DtxR family transcriptional regulator